MNATRAYVVERVSELLSLAQEDATVVNLEKSIYNWTVNRVDEPSWENPWFVNMYRHKFLAFQSNLQKSPHLKDDILNKRFKSKDVIDLEPREAWRGGPWDTVLEDKIHKDMRKQALAEEAKNITGFFTCARCKSKKTTYYQLQTRSADEPMTTYVSCMQCGKNWKC